jgi:hypothetical protein
MPNTVKHAPVPIVATPGTVAGKPSASLVPDATFSYRTIGDTTRAATLALAMAGQTLTRASLTRLFRLNDLRDARPPAMPSSATGECVEAAARLVAERKGRGAISTQNWVCEFPPHTQFHPLQPLVVDRIRSNVPYIETHYCGVDTSAIAARRPYTITPVTSRLNLADGSPTIHRMVTTSDTGSSPVSSRIVCFLSVSNRKPCSEEAAQRPNIKKASAAAVSTPLGVGLVSVYVNPFINHWLAENCDKDDTVPELLWRRLNCSVTPHEEHRERGRRRASQDVS